MALIADVKRSVVSSEDETGGVTTAVAVAAAVADRVEAGVADNRGEAGGPDMDAGTDDEQALATDAATARAMSAARAGPKTTLEVITSPPRRSTRRSDVSC